MTPGSKHITRLGASMLPLPLWHLRSHSTVNQSSREGSPPAPALDEARNLGSCQTHPHSLFPSGLGFSSGIWEEKPWFHLSVLLPYLWNKTLQEIFIALGSLVTFAVWLCVRWLHHIKSRPQMRAQSWTLVGTGGGYKPHRRVHSLVFRV